MPQPRLSATLSGTNPCVGFSSASQRALEERLRRFGSDARKPAMLEDLAASRRRWAALPVLDARSADEIIGGAASKDV
ncbi:type II toxin-antitoxin system VapB family antitoxin [Mesorhizobium sp. M0933]|uniref:type II toxin-antitoxin system VapB family antitoxin n=1 Tax=Mesorhizobium sp. M0933 TaxID=2957030 RepID=UPI0033399589